MISTLLGVEARSRVERILAHMYRCLVVSSGCLRFGGSCAGGDEKAERRDAQPTGMVDAYILVSPKADLGTRLPRIGLSARRVAHVEGSVFTRAGVERVDGCEFVRMTVTVMNGEAPSSDDRQLFRVLARRLTGSKHLELRVKSELPWRLIEEDHRKIIVRCKKEGANVQIKSSRFEPGEYILEVEEDAVGRP